MDLGIYLQLGDEGLGAEEDGRMTLFCCVLMLFPEHLLLASSGVRLLQAGGMCCWLFLWCAEAVQWFSPQESCCHCISPSEPLLEGQSESLFPAYDATGKMLLKVSGAYCRVTSVCFRERKVLALLIKAY